MRREFSGISIVNRRSIGRMNALYRSSVLTWFRFCEWNAFLASMAWTMSILSYWNDFATDMSMRRRTHGECRSAGASILHEGDRVRSSASSRAEYSFRQTI